MHFVNVKMIEIIMQMQMNIVDVEISIKVGKSLQNMEMIQKLRLPNCIYKAILDVGVKGGVALGGQIFITLFLDCRCL